MFLDATLVFMGWCGRWAVAVAAAVVRQPGRRPIQPCGVGVLQGVALALHWLLSACRCVQILA
jgi:hypothetical protein